MNLSSKYSLLIIIVVASITPIPEASFAANNNGPRLNPFELPSGIYSKDNIPKELPQELKLQAIFDIKGRQVATISGENFEKDDYAFGKRVLNIFDNQVILDAGGKEEILVLDDDKFRLSKRTIE